LLVANATATFVGLLREYFGADQEDEVGLRHAAFHEGGHVIAQAQLFAIEPDVYGVLFEVCGELFDPGLVLRAVPRVTDEDSWHA
jgi:hypothetical protein